MNEVSHKDCVRLLAKAGNEMRAIIALYVDKATLASIDHSIARAIKAADGRLPNSELQDLANTATRLTGKAELYSRGLYLDESDRDTPLGRLSSSELESVRDVADVAARSLRAAVADIQEARQEFEEGISWALALADRLGNKDLRLRIEHILQVAQINDTTQVDNRPTHLERRWWAFWEWLG